jgi:hypothetical protein
LKLLLLQISQILLLPSYCIGSKSGVVGNGGVEERFR